MVAAVAATWRWPGAADTVAAATAAGVALETAVATTVGAGAVWRQRRETVGPSATAAEEYIHQKS